MRNRPIFALIILISAMLACTSVVQPTSNTTILGVDVVPPTGSGSFYLTVRFQYTWYRASPPATIFCVYSTPDGSVIPIATIYDEEGDQREKEVVITSKTVQFSVAPKNGVVIPGNYLVGCSTEHTSGPVTAPFTIIGDATPTADVLSNPVPTPTATLQTATLKGRIIFDYNGYQSSRPSGGGELSRVTELCIPDIIIANGGLNGQCEKLHIKALLEDESITVTVTGTIDSSGNITFLYDISEIGNPNGSWRISYQGQGRFTSGTQGSGTASFAFSCSSGQDNLLWCNGQTYESFSGTLPWSFMPAP